MWMGTVLSPCPAPKMVQAGGGAREGRTLRPRVGRPVSNRVASPTVAVAPTCKVTHRRRISRCARGSAVSFGRTDVLSRTVSPCSTRSTGSSQQVVRGVLLSPTAGMVGLGRFELPTSRSRSERSAKLSHNPKTGVVSVTTGGPGRGFDTDGWEHSAGTTPISQPRTRQHRHPTRRHDNTVSCERPTVPSHRPTNCVCGARRGTRTPDLLLVRELL